MKVQGDFTNLLTSLRATCVLPDPITHMLPEAVRPKATVWLENLEKCICPKNQCINALLYLSDVHVNRKIAI